MARIETRRPGRLIRPRGVHFPFTKRSDGFPSADVPRSIFVSNIKQILLTTTGERVMRPRFGSLLRSALFAPTGNPFLLSTLEAIVRDAINTWEPRVDVRGVHIRDEENLISIRVDLFSSFGAVEVEFSLQRL